MSRVRWKPPSSNSAREPLSPSAGYALVGLAETKVWCLSLWHTTVLEQITRNLIHPLSFMALPGFSKHIFIITLIVKAHRAQHRGHRAFPGTDKSKKTIQKSVPSCVNWQLRFRGQMPSRQHAVLVHNTGTLHKTKQVWPQERKGKD